MLDIVLKQKLDKKKSLQTLIDEFIKEYAKTNSKELEEFLKRFYLFIINSIEDMDKELFLELLKEKLSDFAPTFDTNKLESIYEKTASSATLAVASALGVKPIFSFDRVDLKAIQAMKKSFYWVGPEYNKHIEAKIKDVIEQFFEGKVRRDELKDAIKDILKGYIKGSDKYFEGVADHIINQAQNIARVTEAKKYEVEYFKVRARLDSRTSKICRSLHGRLIPIKHLSNQVDKLLSARDIGSKKDAATWKSDYHFGKLPKNLGLPPYHFRCRTMVTPVYLYEEDVDGKKVRFTDKKVDDVLVHIDKTGVQRRVKKSFWTHSSSSKYRDMQKKDIISALNSIKEIAPHKTYHDRFVAKSANGYFLVFKDEELWTAFKPDKLDSYFKKSANIDKKEVIKWKNTI